MKGTEQACGNGSRSYTITSSLEVGRRSIGRWSETSLNTHAECESGLGERLERLQDVCGAEFYDCLRLCNELDDELWEWAGQELDAGSPICPTPQSCSGAFVRAAASLQLVQGRLIASMRQVWDRR